MHHLEALSLAHTEFAQRLARVRPEDWEKRTPCGGLSIRELVHKAVAGYGLDLARLDGVAVPDAKTWIEAWPIPDDYEVAFFQLGDRFEERYGQPRTLDAKVQHSRHGTVNGSTLLSLRVFALTMDAWNLADSLDLDRQLNEGLVATLWEQWSGSPDLIAAYGDGPSGTLAGDAPLQDRLLDLFGKGR